MPDIKIAGADGEFGAYMATPDSGTGPGLVVIQEIFGVNQVMRDLCDAYAEQGYIAVCPDLFWRIEPGVQLTDQSQEEWDRAFELMNGFLPDFEKGVGDLTATMAFIRDMDGCTGKVGCVGYCLGGSLAYTMACQSDSNASVGYYPVQIDDFLEYAQYIKNPAMFHVAELDGFCPPESQDKIAQAFAGNDKISLHNYAGVDHAFARKGGGNFDEGAATLADGRTADFFKANLG